MAEFLHKKSNSNVWYFRRRFPVDVAKVVGKDTHMQSLQTANKRDAERLSRAVSVQFDAICAEARLASEFHRALLPVTSVAEQGQGASGVGDESSLEDVLDRVPALIRLAATRVVEEQRCNPKGWLAVVKGWKSFYEAMTAGSVPPEAQLTAAEAQAFLKGIELVIQGQPVPPGAVPQSRSTERRTLTQGEDVVSTDSWPTLRDRALREYKNKVSSERCKLAESSFVRLKVAGCAEFEIQDSLREWCYVRLQEVKPRTVKTQLDSMVAALRCVLPKLTAPVLRELKGVMQPCVDDRQSMPIQEIRDAVQAFKNKRVSAKVRDDYEGGASQFDAIAVEVLAVLGMRPRELIRATSSALVPKTDVFGERGLFLRLVDGKNKASDREIPLSDGVREVVPVEKLRMMLEWHETNPRSPHGAVSALGTRFKAMTGGRTLYQMRHSWKDIAVNAGVDFELRERLMGHKSPGVSAIYGSGIPLGKGLDALFLMRSTIFGEKR